MTAMYAEPISTWKENSITYTEYLKKGEERITSMNMHLYFYAQDYVLDHDHLHLVHKW